MVKCPYCWEEQWVHKNELYINHNGVKNHYRCYKCGVGAAPKRVFDSPNIIEVPFKGLKPRSPGWRSIYYNNEEVD